jgi:hypothetical protein
MVTAMLMVSALALACGNGGGGGDDALAIETGELAGEMIEKFEPELSREFSVQLDACAVGGSAQHMLRVPVGGTARNVRVWPSADEWIENGFFNPSAGDPNDPESIKMEADQIADTNFGLTWRLEIPDGAKLADVLVRTQTGARPSSVLVGVYRVDRDTGLAQWFATTGRGDFANVYAEPCPMRRVDFRAELTAAAALEPADNTRFVYFATIIAIGGSAGALVYGVDYSFEG